MSRIPAVNAAQCFTCVSRITEILTSTAEQGTVKSAGKPTAKNTEAGTHTPEGIKKICKTCFDDELLDHFIEWHDIFWDEFCEENQDCDNCPLFSPKGCLMIFLSELVDMKLKTDKLKQHDLKRIQRKNLNEVLKWKKQFKEITGGGKTRET